MLRWPCSRLITLGLLCCTMTACKHEHTLMPTPSVYVLNPDVDPFANVPPEQRGSAVHLLYATDRVPTTDEDGAFGYGWERSPSLAFGRCTMQIGESGLSWDDLVRASRTAEREVELPLSVTSIEELGRGPSTPHISEHNAAEQARMDAAFLTELRARLAQTPRKEKSPAAPTGE